MAVAPVVRPTLSCRFYEERFPELHEAVNTNVTEIGEMGAYVKLLEYNNVGGKILQGVGLSGPRRTRKVKNRKKFFAFPISVNPKLEIRTRAGPE